MEMSKRLNWQKSNLQRKVNERNRASLTYYSRSWLSGGRKRTATAVIIYRKPQWRWG
jgi:hypothetical protein